MFFWYCIYLWYMFFSPKKIRCDHNLTQFKIVEKNDIFDEKWEFGTKKSLWKGYFLGNFLFFYNHLDHICVCWWKKQWLLGKLTHFKKYWKNVFFGAKIVFLAPPNQLFPILQNFFFVIFGFSIPKYIKKTTRRKYSKEKVLRWAALLCILTPILPESI